MDINSRTRVKGICRSAVAVLLVIAMVLSSIPQTTRAAAVKTATTSAATAATSTAATAVTVSTQEQLISALADKSIKTITITSAGTQTFTIPSGAYATKTLVIDSSKASIANSGSFKRIVVTNAKTFTENAEGNSITVNDKALTFKAAIGAKIKTLTIARSNANIKIVANGAIDRIILSKKAEIGITGSAADSIVLQIKTLAKGSQVTTAVPIDVTTATDADLFLQKGAESSKVTSTETNINLKVENKTKKKVVITTPDGKKTITAGKTFAVNNAPTVTPGGTEPTAVPAKGTEEGNKSNSSAGTSGNTTYDTITYETDGGTSIASEQIIDGYILNTLPTPQKENSIFLGWYTDAGHQKQFSEGTVVFANLTLYAKYSVIEIEQQNLNDSFALTDQQAGLSFTITGSDTGMTPESVKSGLELSVADGSIAVELLVTGSNGTYLVSGQGGFTEGASYTLTLSDSTLNFQDQESTVRKCSFNITKAEVYNIALNNGIIYISKSMVSDMTKDGTQVESLSLPIVQLSETGNTEVTTVGTVTYTGNVTLKVGDVLCIYSGEQPTIPSEDGSDAQYLDDDIAYINVTAVTGSIGSQMVTYSDAAAEEVIFLPDVLPIAVGEGSLLTDYSAAADSGSGSFTAIAANLNFSAYSDMGLSETTTIDVGDYLAFYTGTYNDENNTAPAEYGEVTSVTEIGGIVTVAFTPATVEEIQECQDYYSKNDVDANSLIEGVDIASMQEEIEQQVQDSGFAEDASVYLTALALETDGFGQMAGEEVDLESFSISMADGTNADLKEIQSMAIDSGSAKVSIDNLTINANISKNLKKLSGQGLRCAVSVSFDVPVKTGDDTEINISLTATFVEELKLSVDATGKAIWKWKWIFPYIADYQMSANVDVYDYTGISFKAIISSKADTETIDISEEIQKILSYTDSKEVSASVQELFEIYGDMMQNETDWIQIFSQNISTSNTSLLLGIIQIRTTVDFVVSADINVALGCNFEYMSGTRYCFWAKLKAKDAGSDTIDLMDEKYTFQFYVMGCLGLRAGIKLEFAVGLFSVDLNSVGLTAEAGVYTRLYGYFFYQLESVNKVKNSKMSGALYMELGIYLEIAFKAQVLKGKFQYNPTLYENEWPLLTAGARYNVYNFAYEDIAKTIKLKDTVKTYTLPDSTFNMTYLDLREGDISTKAYTIGDFKVTFSNSSFSLDKNIVKVNVPKDTYKLECDMTISWKSSALAFSSVAIARTIHFIWDDLNDNGYTITYDSKGGSFVNNVTKLYDAVVTAPAVPTKIGYTFGGWYSDATLATAYLFTRMPAKNTVLYAKWTANINTLYKVEHYQQNLENDNYTLYTSEVMTGTTAATVAATAKTYAGFLYNSNTKDTVSSGIVAADGSLVLKQYYNRSSYNLTFKPANGGIDIVKIIKFGAAISAPTVVSTGATFSSWDKAVAGVMPAADTTYTALWIVNNYSIEFNSNGGDVVNKITQTYQSTVNAPAAPAKSGFVFAGWYSDSSLTKPYSFTTMSAENITLFAKWESGSVAYKVEHYQQNLGNDNYTLYLSENMTGTIGTTVTATAKTYTGFLYNSTNSEAVSSGIVAANGSLVLKLYYNRNSYSLTFQPLNGDTDIVITVKYGAAITAPTVVKTGAIFSGWDNAVVGTMPAANTTYTAVWILNNYSIEFDSNGSVAVSKITQAYQSTVNAPTPPTKSGYTFAGWYSDIDLTTPYTFSSMQLGDIIVYAKWTEEVVDPGNDVLMEAENAVLYGNTMIENNPKASNGAHAGFMDGDGSGVKFINMNASTSIILCYSSESNGTFNVYVKGVKVGAITLNSTGSYMDNYKKVKITGLNLINGDSLSFQYDSGNIPINIDYIAYTVSDADSLDTVPIH